MRRLSPLFAVLLLGCPPDAPPNAPPAPPEPRAETPPTPPTPPPEPLKLVAWTGEKSDMWEKVEKLQGEQKYEAAAAEVKTILEKAQADGDSEELVRAVIRTVQLRTALHGYETAVRFLDELRWPDDLLGRTTLNLYFAHSLVNYANRYGWEIRSREQVVSRDEVDLKKWTWAQIHQHAHQQYFVAWQQREGLGQQSLSAVKDYLNANNYPRAIRSTLRDAVTYLWAQLLSNTGTWRPEQQNGVHRLDLDALLADEVPLPKLDDPEVHPLRKFAAILSDLEQWHRAAGRAEAAFEARRYRLEQLHSRLTDAEDRERIRANLRAALDAVKGEAWWSMGMATLANLVQQQNAADTPDRLIEARKIALEGQQAYPESIGGQRCRSIAESIEAPSMHLDGMLLDGVKRRSLGVRHKNLKRLNFRAWRFDLKKHVEAQQDYNLLPDARFVMPIIDDRKPVAEWAVDLPATPDYQQHRTWVVPPLDEKGAYIVAATPDDDFERMKAPMQVTILTVSDLVVVDRAAEKRIEVRVFEGPTGEPASGAELLLYRFDWRSKHKRVGVRTTNADGEAVFKGAPGHQHFLIARRGDDLSISHRGLHFGHDRGVRRDRAAFVYTDRSVYRPGQTLHWQVVAWQGDAESAKFRVEPKTSVKVSLVDGNGQEVVAEAVTTNEFGSGAGTFTIPAGRALGRWQLQTDRDTRGGALRVEEYKRPTFEAELEAPKDQLRLNQPAKLTGEARYYFGLPVTAGQVEWRVERRANYPWWWGWYWGGGANTAAERVGTGTTKLDDEGQFVVEFTPKADERLAEGKGRAVTYSYTVEAEITDEGGETRTAKRTLRVGFVAVQANVELPADFLTAGRDAELTITRMNLDGEPAPGKGSWRLLKLESPAETPTPAEMPLSTEGQPYATPGDAQRPRWNPGYDPRIALNALEDGAEVARGDLEHGEKGKAKLTLKAPAAGAYRLRYNTTDAFGAEYTTEQIVVVGAERMPVGIPLDLRVETGSVEVGGAARVLVYSGFPGQAIVLDTWRDGERLARRLVRAGKDPALIEIPVSEKDRGGFALTAQLVRDHQHLRLSRSVSVPWSDKRLKVSFATFRDTLRPGQKETWTVSVQGPDAEAASAEVLAYMYDKSLDIFAPHSPPAANGVYPWRANAPWVRANLIAAPRVYVQSGSFPAIPSAPSLRDDQLIFPSGWGIGGMGFGGLGAVGAGRGGGGRGEMRTRMAPAATAAPAPPSEDATLAEGEVEAEESDDSGGDSLDRQAKVATGTAAGQGEPEIRADFSETAFFQPQLRLGPEGRVDIVFEVPDSVTSWNVWVHAVGKDLSYGRLHEETRTVKELMVRPYLPRFLREGDAATLEVVVNNAGEKPLSGTLDFDIIDPETEASLLKDFGLASEQARGLAFEAKEGGSARLSFPVKTPARLGQIAFKVVATAGDFSDGELRPIPVLPGRVHLAQSRFTTLKGAETKTLRFADLAKDDDPTRIDEQLVVTLDGQLFYGVLAALPYLVNYPYECTEQTLNRFVSTGILSSLYGQYPAVAKMAKKLSARDTALEKWDAPDPNRKLMLEETPWLRQAKGGVAKDFEKVLDPAIAKATRNAALTKLRKSQTSLGGFPWWSGGPPSPYMTLYLLHGFSKAIEFGVEVPKDLTRRAWQYLKRHHIDEALRHAMAHDCCWEHITFVNYVLSNYPDGSWGGDVFSDADRKQMLDFSFSHWKQHSPYLKAYLALTLARADRRKDAELVWESVLDSAKEKPDQGTFWAPEDRAWLWYNDRIETHAFALRTTMELKPKWPKLDGVVLWLFLNKKLNHWKSTRATAEVIYSLAHYLKATGQLAAREETVVTIGDLVKTFVFEPDEFSGQKNQVVVKGPDIEPKEDAEIVIAKKSEGGMQLASATWHFSTEKMPAEAHGDFLGLTRTYYRRDKSGREVTLTPLKEGAKIEVGDEVEVHLSLRSKHALEYVHLRDPRAAGFEPTSLRSEHKWDMGVRWFEEVRDSATNFFFERLPHGEYTFKYRLRATTKGTFKVGPATVQPMYAPEFVAYSAGHVLSIAKP